MENTEADSAIRTKGSLCSGTGALDAAVPGELAFLAETNPGAVRILKRRHSDVPNLGDITAPYFRPHHVDLLTSGDPCQSMSSAGLQAASEDERFLWPYVMDVIDRTRPRHIFLENVQNITSVALVKGGERGGVLRLRLDSLREAGYAARWTVLGACAVGAPHHRHRWFLRAEHVGGTPEAERVISKCGAPRTGGRLLLPTPTTADGSGGPGAQGRAGGLNLRTAVTLLPTPRATDGVNGGPNQRGRKGDLAMGSAVQEQHWGKFAEAVALWEQITGRVAPLPTVPAPKGGRRLNAELSEWMMGLPLGYATAELDRNEALRAIGNGVVVAQARAAWDLLA